MSLKIIHLGVDYLNPEPSRNINIVLCISTEKLFLSKLTKKKLLQDVKIYTITTSINSDHNYLLYNLLSRGQNSSSTKEHMSVLNLNFLPP